MPDAKRVDWSTDAHGFVTGVRYHDGTLIELGFDADSAHAVVAVTGGGMTRFHFRGGIAFGSLGAVNQAIVDRVWAARLTSSMEISRDLVHAVHVLNGGMLLPDDDVAASRNLLWKEGGLLVSFSCSYGGPFTILADEMWCMKAGY